MKGRVAALAGSLLAGLIPLAGSVLLAVGLLWGHPPRLATHHPVRLLQLYVPGAHQLAAVFSGYGYRWPPLGRIPPLRLERLPRDLASVQPDRRKDLFLRALLPLVLAANDRIRRERQFIRNALDGKTTTPPERRRLERLAQKYRVSAPLSTPGARATLLRRCDTVPVGLVLAQAAKESGWGTSYFARQANNLFGVWTWHAQEGVVPTQRARGAQHLVRAYPNLASSVNDYLYNLNVGHAYVAMRKRRAALRAKGKHPTPLALAPTLDYYSQRRSTYTERLSVVIAENGLNALPALRLATLPTPLSLAIGPTQGNKARFRSQ